MALPLLAMALGGAAVGALANKKDRKKGALMGLGAGLLGPAIGAMGGAGAATTAPLAAAAPAAAVPAAAVVPAAATIPAATAAAVPASGGVTGFAKSIAPAMLPLVMPKKGPPPPQAGGSYANNSQSQAGAQQDNLYAQAMINKQERMKGRNHRRSFK